MSIFVRKSAFKQNCFKQFQKKSGIGNANEYFDESIYGCKVGLMHLQKLLSSGESLEHTEK